MHDFELTIPYGLFLFFFGLIGRAFNGNPALYDCFIGAGSMLLCAAIRSLIAFVKRKNSYLALIFETGITAWLTYVMREWYRKTPKIMPVGLIGVTSAFMTAFYLHKIAMGGNRFPPQ